MASTIVLTPSTDKTGAADTAAINTALGGVGAGGSVLLDPGDWYTSAPLDIPGGWVTPINLGNARNGYLAA